MAFCGIMEVKQLGKIIRTEDQIRKALSHYQGNQISQFFFELQEHLAYLESYTGRTDILIGYFDKYNQPQIGYYTIDTTNSTNIQFHLKSSRQYIAAGKHADIIHILSDNFPINEQTLSQIVQVAISLENIKPEGFRAVGGRVQTDCLFPE